jgi:hypothetical protein
MGLRLRVLNPQGCQKVAGGRSGADTPVRDDELRAPWKRGCGSVRAARSMRTGCPRSRVIGASAYTTGTGAGLQRARWEIQRAPRPIQRAARPIQQAPRSIQQGPRSMQQASGSMQQAPPAMQQVPGFAERAPAFMESAPAPMEHGPACVGWGPA